MAALRQCCRISRRQRVRNEIIKEMIKLEVNVCGDIHKKQLIWFGHVMRENEETARDSLEF